MNFTKVGTWREVCRISLSFSAPPTLESLRSTNATKNFCSLGKARLAPLPEQRARRPSSTGLWTLSASGRTIQQQPSCNTVLARAVLASVVVRGKKLRRKNGQVFRVKASRGRRKRRSHVRQVAFPQLPGFTLVPFGRIFAALRHTSTTAELRLTRSTKIKRREGKVCF